MSARIEWVLKRFAKKLTIVGMAVTLLSIPAMADSAEQPWKKGIDANKAPKTTQSGGWLRSFLPAKSPGAKPASAPIKTTTSVVGGPTPITAKKKTKKISKRKTRKRRKAKTVAAISGSTSVKKITNNEAAWWETVGNPAVFAFRDCSAKYATEQVAAGAKIPASGLITRAMKTTCQLEFAKMAGVLIGGLGEKRSNTMLAELAKTTFLPTVKAAMVSEKDQQIVVKTARVEKLSEEKNLENAKAAMFRCFSEKSDRLSAAKSTSAHTIADSVLIGCQNHSDAFFDLLFAHSKAGVLVKQQQKNIALNETYRMAIIRRVLATRKTTEIKTATGVAQ